MSNFFNWFGKLLAGESAKSNGDGEKSAIEDKKPEENSVETREKIKKATVKLLNSLYMTNPEKCKSKRVIVWLDTDTTTFKSFDDFAQELAENWAIERGYTFEKVEVKHGKPEKEQDARKVNVDIDSVAIYLQEQTVEEENHVKKACISVYGSNGSLLQEKYELSSEVLEKERRKYYHIGRGEHPDMEDGSYRQNHIVIDENNNLDKNKYVSRAHARIGYSENIGFYLQVEYGGSRLSGNRTRIFRDEEKIEVENVDMKEPLHDGDLIELGKAVLLQYKEIK